MSNYFHLVICGTLYQPYTHCFQFSSKHSIRLPSYTRTALEIYQRNVTPKIGRHYKSWSQHLTQSQYQKNPSLVYRSLKKNEPNSLKIPASNWIDILLKKLRFILRLKRFLLKTRMVAHGQLVEPAVCLIVQSN